MSDNRIPERDLGSSTGSPTDMVRVVKAGKSMTVAADSLPIQSAVQIELTTLKLGQGSLLVAFPTVSEMNANLAHPANTPAWVATGTDTEIGTYRKIGAIGTGSWVKVPDRVSGVEGNVALLLGITHYEHLPGVMQLLVDGAGDSRVVETSARGELERFPPPDTGAISNIGSGAQILSGAADLRTLEGRDGVVVFVEGDQIIVSGDGGAEAAPTEFVMVLVIGQSNNTVEGGNEAEATTIPNGVAYEYRDGYASLLDLASDPNAQRATVMPAMASEFWRRTGLGVIFVNSAFGSSAMAAAASPAGLPDRNWDTTGTLRGLAVTRMNAARAMADAAGINWQNGWISWSQGEQDGQQIDASTITIAVYKTAFAGLITHLHANVGAKVPFIITRTSYRSTDTTGYQQIRAAQMEFSATIEGVYMGYTGTMRFFADGLMNDSVHYNQTGKNEVGKRVGAIASVLSAGVN